MTISTSTPRWRRTSRPRPRCSSRPSRIARREPRQPLRATARRQCDHPDDGVSPSRISMPSRSEPTASRSAGAVGESRLHLGGAFNVANALAAAEAALAAGLDEDHIAAGLSRPRGRAGPFRGDRRRRCRSPSWSTTPTPPMPSSSSSNRRAEWPEKGRSRWCSVPAATVTRPSDRPWVKWRLGSRIE